MAKPTKNKGEQSASGFSEDEVRFQDEDDEVSAPTPGQAAGSRRDALSAKLSAGYADAVKNAVAGHRAAGRPVYSIDAFKKIKQS